MEGKHTSYILTHRELSFNEGRHSWQDTVTDNWLKGTLDGRASSRTATSKWVWTSECVCTGAACVCACSYVCVCGTSLVAGTMRRGKRAPGVHCSCMLQVSMVTCILLLYTKITTNFSLPPGRPHGRAMLLVRIIWKDLKSEIISL